MKAILEIPVRRVVFLLSGAVVLLFLLALPAPIFRFGLGHDYVYGFVPFAEQMFDLDLERNPATWFSSVLLLVSALLLGYVGLATRAVRDAYGRHWLILAGIFLYLSLDEATAIHERANALKDVLDLGGVLRFAWVIPGAAFVGGVALAYIRFLRSLPGRTRRLFILAGALYVGGALGLELFQAYYADTMLQAYWTSLRRVLLSHAEELMEMGGIVLFIYALLDYIRARFGPIVISLEPTGNLAIPMKGTIERGARTGSAEVRAQRLPEARG